MRASQSHQSFYFDGCGHTDSHNHTVQALPPCFLPLPPHTSFDSKAHKHTSWPAGGEGRKSIFEELSGLVAPDPPLAVAYGQTVEFATRHVAQAGSHCSFYHFITFDYSVSLCLDKRNVQPCSYTSHTCMSRFLKCSVTTSNLYLSRQRYWVQKTTTLLR